MTPQDALTLEYGDIILFQSQTYAVITVFAHGYMIRLLGQHMNPEVPTAKCVLVYRRDAIPPGFTVGPLNATEEAEIRQVIQERIRKEQEG